MDPLKYSGMLGPDDSRTQVYSVENGSTYIGTNQVSATNEAVKFTYPIGNSLKDGHTAYPCPAMSCSFVHILM